MASTPEDTLFITVYVLLACAILCNGLGLYLLTSLRDKRTPQAMILISLSFDDILLAISWIVSQPVRIDTQDLIRSISLGLYVVWFSMIYMLTIDRFIGVNFPIKHKVFVTKKVVGIIIASCWICGSLLSVIACVTEPLTVNNAFRNYGYIALDLSFLVFFVVTYASILFRLAKRRAQKSQSSRANKNHKFFATVSAILVAFLMFETIPTVLESLLTEKKKEPLENIRALLYTINLLCDPIIYVFLQPPVRANGREKLKAIWKLIKCPRQCQCGTSELAELQVPMKVKDNGKF